MNLKTALAGKYVIAGTGSRSFAELTMDRKVSISIDLSWYLTHHEQWDNMVILSGGATGWDHQIARIAHRLQIPYYLAIPNSGYGAYYWKADMDRWRNMVQHAAGVEFTMEEVHQSNSLYLNGVHSNFVRNERMVELASEFVVYDPSSAGTKHCVNLITLNGLPWREFR